MRRYRFISTLLWLSLLASACVPIRPVTTPPATGASTAPVASDSATSDNTALVSQVAQWQLTDPLPVDPNLRVGKLANGLTYVIRRNGEPAQRAELRLAVNAGSLLEDADQQGLAHLLEHMMFNGTQRFPKQALVDYLESIGMQFGADVNAYTSFDETVYMLQVPTDQPKIVGKAFDILEDWAGHATLDPVEIDKERGVVVEEWRLRDKGAQGRIVNQWYPFVLAGSQYAQRLPIGQMEVVRNAPAEALQRFYQRWYRPELMTVVAVGDFDLDQVEGLIKEHFDRLPTSQQPTTRPDFAVPPSTQDRILTITDPEYPYALVDLTYHQAAKAEVTVGDFHDQLLIDLANQMLNARYDEISRQQNAPFVGAVSYQNTLVRPVQENGVQAQVEENKILTGTLALVTELERVRRYGFTETELIRAKATLLRGYEQQYAEREKSDSGSYAGAYVDAFLTQAATPGIAIRYALAQRFLPAIQLAEVNQQATTLLQNQSRYLLVVAPEKKELTLPSEAELAAVLTQVQAAQIEPYVDQVAAAQLMTTLPAPVAIISETTDSQLGITQFTLANGVQVILKPTDFKADEVLLRAVSPGGSSLVADADFREADNISTIVTNSGVGDFDYNGLTRLLNGKVVNLSPYIDQLNEGFQGSSSTKDLETLLQLLYLYVTKPRADKSAFTTFQDQMRTALENRSLSVDAAFGDAITHARYGDSIRYRPLTLAEVDGFDLQRAVEIYHERFADTSDFTFVFVGNFDVDALKKLTQIYLGNLPAGTRHENWKDVKPNPPPGQIEQTIYKGQDEQSRSFLLFTGTIDPTPRNRLLLRLLQDVLDIRLRNDLREERSGTYSPGVSANIAKNPDQSYGFYVTFGSDPKRVEELIKATWGDIADVKAQGPHADEFEKVTEQARRSHEKALRENQYWLTQLGDHAADPAEPLDNLLSFDETLASIQPADIQQAATDYLPIDRYIKVIQLPEAAKK